MQGLGTVVNVVAVLVGGGLGLALKRFLSARITGTVTQGLGLAVVVIGFSGVLGATFTVADDRLASRYTLLMIISLAVGGLIGEWADLEDWLNRFAAYCEKKFARKDDSATFAQGFVTASLVFCVGAMAIVGALEDGINGNADYLYAKSALDAVSAMVFASVFGLGVLFSAVAVGVYQGVITVCAVLIAPYLSDTLVTQMSMVGSVLIVGIGLNMLKMTKIKVGNLLPAIFVPVIYQLVRGLS